MKERILEVASASRRRSSAFSFADPSLFPGKMPVPPPIRFVLKVLGVKHPLKHCLNHASCALGVPESPNGGRTSAFIWSMSMRA